jgi:hypothetical protein
MVEEGGKPSGLKGGNRKKGSGTFEREHLTR